MAKRKAESLSRPEDGVKKAKHVDITKPVSKPALMDDSESEDESDGGVELAQDFKVNEDYAKRFEHNKKREELQRCKSYGNWITSLETLMPCEKTIYDPVPQNSLETEHNTNGI